jgi:hypothetical protein
MTLIKSGKFYFNLINPIKRIISRIDKKDEFKRRNLK